MTVKYNGQTIRGKEMLILTLLSRYPALLILFLFVIYFLSMPTYFSCYPVFVSLSLSSVCITVSSSPSRTFTLPCLSSYSVSLFQMHFFIPIPCFFRPHPRYFLLAPYLCSVTFAVTTFSFSSDFFMILNMTL